MTSTVNISSPITYGIGSRVTKGMLEDMDSRVTTGELDISMLGIGS